MGRSGPSWKRIRADLKAAQATATQAERRRCAEVIEAWNERIKVRRNPGHVAQLSRVRQDGLQKTMEPS
jgi:hypothetical protein